EEARRIWREVDRPNLMVKIPGTKPGIPAIRQMISEGVNINVTLLFSADAYAEVAEAYISGLEAYVAKGGDPHHVASVASLFISRIAALVDELIGADTVNTMPPPTMDAARDHGKPRASLEENVAAAQAVMDALPKAGIDFNQVTAKLVDDAVRLFVDAADTLYASVQKKRQMI